MVDTTGKIVREVKVASEPEALARFFGDLGFPVARIGLEAGPLSQWLYAGLSEAGLAAVLLETRHVKAALSAMPIRSGVSYRNWRRSWTRPKKTYWRT